MTGTAYHWNPPETSIWHDAALIDGKPYPTRHPVPHWVEDIDGPLSALTDEQQDAMRAVHEAAHAVAILAAGGYVHQVWIRRTADLRATDAEGSQIGGNAAGCNVSDGLDFVTVMGAGERAEDRWLRETDRWTPVLALGVEFGAYTDRRAILDLNPGLGFCGGSGDFQVVHEVADRFVDEHWERITAVACALSSRLSLTGEEVAVLASLPNGTGKR